MGSDDATVAASALGSEVYHLVVSTLLSSDEHQNIKTSKHLNIKISSSTPELTELNNKNHHYLLSSDELALNPNNFLDKHYTPSSRQLSSRLALSSNTSTGFLFA